MSVITFQYISDMLDTLVSDSFNDSESFLGAFNMTINDLNNFFSTSFKNVKINTPMDSFVAELTGIPDEMSECLIYGLCYKITVQDEDLDQQQQFLRAYNNALYNGFKKIPKDYKNKELNRYFERTE